MSVNTVFAMLATIIAIILVSMALHPGLDKSMHWGAVAVLAVIGLIVFVWDRTRR